MRLTRSTLAIIIVALVVIVAVLAFSASPASAPPAPTEIPTLTAGGPLFPGLTTDAISRFAVKDLATSVTVTYLRDSAGVWTLENDASGYTIDSAAMERNAGAFSDLMAYDTFPTEALQDYGLEAPAYLVTVQTADGASAELYVGGINPTGNRQYVVAAMHAATDSTAEATPAPDSFILTGTQAVSTVVSSTVQGWIRMFESPTFIPTPPPTPTPEMTAEATAEATTAP
ncbi:MAG TPA: DUF4340 domain-containing protein [Candidatus Limnocylindrales bacterium]|nr:DUF4340 domain-containing protein [Candidatus Limnocylindrales bacterium]